MKVRLEAVKTQTVYSNAKKVRQRFNLANKYFKFLGSEQKEGF